MSNKPSYLGLLNAVSNAETRAARYFNAWAALTDDPDVKFTVKLVAVREAEHGLAFEKRIMELGYTLLDRPDPKADEKLAFISNPALSDLERLDYLGYTKPRDEDPFGAFFADRTIDIETGALIGRYVAEERDTIRRLTALADKLKAQAPKKRAAKKVA